MKNNLRAEAHILDRMMHLLEEESVAQLMHEDNAFADYVADLYSSINAKSRNLRRAA